MFVLLWLSLFVLLWPRRLSCVFQRTITLLVMNHPPKWAGWPTQLSPRVPWAHSWSVSASGGSETGSPRTWSAMPPTSRVDMFGKATPNMPGHKGSSIVDKATSSMPLGGMA